MHVSARRRKSSSAIPEWFTADNILDGIHVYRAHDEAAQTAIIIRITIILEETSRLGNPSTTCCCRFYCVSLSGESRQAVLVKHKIATHSSYCQKICQQCASAGSDYMARTRSLNMIAAFLADLASQFDVAVVLVNQMTTKVGDNDTSKLVPALGESWGHAMTTRILLSQVGDDSSIRRCTLVKSPHKAAGTALYEIRECGIRDAPSATIAAAESAKRPRTN